MPRRSPRRLFAVLGVVVSVALLAPVVDATALAPGGATGSRGAVTGSLAAPLPPGAALRHTAGDVVGYLPYWTLDASSDGWLDYGHLSDIVLFSVGFDADGHLITTGSGYADVVSAAADTVIAHAHRLGVRVLVSFTSFGSDKNAAFFTNPAAEATFVQEAAALVAARGLDGADFDVELIGGTYFPAYAQVAGALRAAMRTANPVALMSVATNGNVSGASMAKAALAAGVDRAFVMGYSYRTGSTSPVGSNDPLIRADGGMSLSRTLDLYASAGVPFGHLVLGLPLYGLRWETTDASLDATRAPGSAAGVVRTFSQVASGAGTDPVTHDPVEISGQLVHVDPATGVITQTYFDSPADTAAKTALVLTRGLAGVGFWALGYDTGAGTVAGSVAAAAAVLAPPRLATPVIAGVARTLAVSVTLGWTDGANPAATYQLSNDGQTWSAALPLGRTPVPWTLATGVDGRRAVYARIADATGAMSLVTRATTLLDRVAPALSSPRLAWSSTAGTWRVSWSATDRGSGVARYRVLGRLGTGAWQQLAITTRPSILVPRAWRYRHFTIMVRAFDQAGNYSIGRSVRR